MKYILKLLFLITIATGCRCHRDATRETRHEATELARMEYRKIDSVWSSMSERETIKFCFFPYDSVCTASGETPKPSVRSIEITRETVTENTGRSETDSASVKRRNESDFKSVEKHTQASDGGSVMAIVVIVLVLCVAVLFLQRKN